jgi:hypothetical protein
VAEIVNLRRRRRQAARDAARREGNVNAARHGRTKAETALTEARAEKAARDLEAHRREPEPPAEE